MKKKLNVLNEKIELKQNVNDACDAGSNDYCIEVDAAACCWWSVDWCTVDYAACCWWSHDNCNEDYA